MAIVHDPSHRIANNLELALKHSGQWLYALTMSLVYNLHWGPWNGCRWQHEAKAAVRDLCAVFKAGDALGRWAGPKILDDWGEGHRIHEDGIMEEVWNRLPTTRTFQCRLKKCSLTRWMGWLDAAADHDSGWHSRAVVYCFMGLSHGWLRKTTKSFDLTSLVKRTGGARPSEPAKKSTASHCQPIEVARSVLQNNMHIAVHALLEDGFRERARMICDVMSPARLLHGVSVKECRSAETTMAYYSRCSTGENWVPCLSDIVQTLQTGDLLERWGLVTTISAWHGTGSSTSMTVLHNAWP